MIIKRLQETPSFLAGDLTTLKELMHPKNDGIALSYSLAYAALGPGAESLPHRLVKNSEVYFFLEGQGQMCIDDETAFVGKGDTVFVPANARQYIKNVGEGELSFICIVSPPWSEGEEEVE